MLTGLVRAALLAEALACACIGAWVVSRRGWTIGQVATVAVAASLTVRFAWVAATMVLSARAARQRPRQERLRVLEGLRLLARESGAIFTCNYLLVPFHRIAVPRDDPLRPAEGVPVVLVHGYFVNRGYWAALMRRLREARVGPVFAPDLPGAFVTIERFAQALATEVERITQATGQPRVVLVCHSMGGLAARRYIADGGGERVARLVTLGSPHAGTELGRFGIGASARQMQPGCPFLETLARDEQSLTERPPTASIYSLHDNLVSPQVTCCLPWARNIALRGEGHVAMLWSRAVHDLVREELRAAGVRGA